MLDSLRSRAPAMFGQELGALKPTLFLFAVDTLANAIDYAFHIFLGRSLDPGDFGVFQTVNSALLIAVTAFGVMQPVLARFVAEAETRKTGGSGLSEESAGLFRTYIGWSLIAGVILSTLLLVMGSQFAGWLNVPAYAVRYGAIVVLLILLRPVVAGTLQGAQRFVSFGITRLAYAAGRFGFAAFLLGLGTGLVGAVSSLPVGQLAAVGIGIVFLGGMVFQKEHLQPSPESVRQGVRLAGWAFAAFAAFTTMQNLDLFWVNRFFTPEESGAYAAAVLLRRILVLFPGAAAIVMYPRIVASITRGQVPDRLIGLTLFFVSGSVTVLVALYAVAGPAIVRLAFGAGYEAAGPILGWMGFATLAFGIASIWLNLFLATRPQVFVIFLGAATLFNAAALSLWHADLNAVVTVFGISGWLLAIGGGLIYVFWLRPKLLEAQTVG